MRTLGCLMLILVAMTWPMMAFAVGPATHRAKQPSAKQLLWKQLEQDLLSGDAQRVASADQHVQDIIFGRRHDLGVFQGVNLLLKTKRFEEVDSTCMASMLAHADNPDWVAKCQRARVLALLGLGKNDDALTAAKSYYNVVRFAQTKDGINLVALCLAKARPNGVELTERFKRQQTAWASPGYSPVTQPSASTTQPASEAADLGEAILPTISVDPKPWEEAMGDIVLDDYNSYVAKGNLLLLSDQAADAKEVFDEAMTLAAPQQATTAVENVARAIRAENGCAGPANAYVLSMRAKEHPVK